jgi:hypothetical protein
VEFQPPPIGSVPLTNGSARPTTGEWPAVPPAPAPVKPAAPTVTPEPPLIRSTVPPASAPAPVPAPMAPSLPTASGPDSAADSGSLRVTDDSPTVTIPAPPEHRALPPLVRQSPILQLRRALRSGPRSARNDLVWQPRFAYGTAGIILAALVVLTLPLWVVVFRMTDPAANNGAGPKVASLVALCMMLTGAFVTGAATWMILVEMRARVRMVDALAGVGVREMTQYPPGYGPAFDPAHLDPAHLNPAHLDPAYLDPAYLGPAYLSPTYLSPANLGPAPGEMNQPVTAPIFAGAGAHHPARAQADAVITLGGPGRQRTPLNGVPKSLGQLHAQIAMLAVALALFVGATVLGAS